MELLLAGQLIVTALVKMVAGMTVLLGVLALISAWLFGCVNQCLEKSPLLGVLAFVFPPYGLICGCSSLWVEWRENRLKRT
ncbi:hypothetical protein [Pseudomonas amygdali]|uniref:hypothetical protein n=1 Tax=Pseudomonas amygdali TaxID=47877 RepID=UPI000B262658|nr:hypothetical protein [Pseudomonas amygdali]RMT05834.1 hypothetical protein ALP54_03761 [Pseudomonas amygdali pv. lachrymans]